MNTRKKRRSVSLPVQVAQRIYRLAKTQRKSTNRVIVELIESGLHAKQAERQHFLALADRLASTEDERERERLKKELAKLTFGK